VSRARPSWQHRRKNHGQVPAARTARVAILSGRTPEIIKSYPAQRGQEGAVKNADIRFNERQPETLPPPPPLNPSRGEERERTRPREALGARASNTSPARRRSSRAPRGLPLVRGDPIRRAGRGAVMGAPGLAACTAAPSVARRRHSASWSPGASPDRPAAKERSRLPKETAP